MVMERCSNGNYSDKEDRCGPSRRCGFLIAMISHVKFVSIPTRDQPRALKFWTEQVGFKVLTDQPFDDKQRWIELRVGSSETRVVLFMMDEGGVQPGMRFNASFACDNVERTYEELSGRGVTFVTKPEKQPWGTFAIFTDPDGNQFVMGSK